MMSGNRHPQVQGVGDARAGSGVAGAGSATCVGVADGAARVAGTAGTVGGTGAARKVEVALTGGGAGVGGAPLRVTRLQARAKPSRPRRSLRMEGRRGFGPSPLSATAAAGEG